MHARMTTLTVPSGEQAGAVESYSDTIKLSGPFPGIEVPSCSSTPMLAEVLA
jgi:hypothetical protein